MEGHPRKIRVAISLATRGLARLTLFTLTDHCSAESPWCDHCYSKAKRRRRTLVVSPNIIVNSNDNHCRFDPRPQRHLGHPFFGGALTIALDASFNRTSPGNTAMITDVCPTQGASRTSAESDQVIVEDGLHDSCSRMVSAKVSQRPPSYTSTFLAYVHQSRLCSCAKYLNDGPCCGETRKAR
jgi:hypothetical protein